MAIPVAWKMPTHSTDECTVTAVSATRDDPAMLDDKALTVISGLLAQRAQSTYFTLSQPLLCPGAQSLLHVLHGPVTSRPRGVEVAVDDVRLAEEIELDFGFRT